ncbi:MAG: exo-alpha-sialidase [Planctomycetes bacterium]|nr:exo-alpha-sialidase [Planctomycetota bacterium]
MSILLLALAQSVPSTPPGPRALDLAHDTARQVTVDRQAGQYLGHPTTVLLADGRTILCVYPEGHGKGAIQLKRSLDGGRTWSERQALPKSFESSLETPTIHRIADTQGKERLVLFSGLHPCRMAHSEDQGRTWSELAPLGDWGGIVAMGSVVRMKDGSSSAFFHDDGRFFRASGKSSGSFTLYQTRSNDGGLTWSEPASVWSGSEIHLCEPGVVRSPEGNELAMLLRENRRAKNSHVMFSRDEAATWSAPREVSSALTGDRHVAAYAPDGRLVVSFRDMARESATQGDWVAWVGRYEDLARSGDGQYRVRLMDNRDRWDCGYPGLEVLADGTFVATSYGHWAEGEAPYIVSVHFRLSELDQLAAR